MMASAHLHRAAQAARIIFFLAGVGTSPWASIIPFIKTKLELNEIYFALLVLSFGLGATVSMPLTALIVRYIGVKRTLMGSLTLLYFAMWGLSIIDLSYAMCFVFVILWGISLGLVDVSMNIYGSNVEQLSNKSLMSGFHSFYSIGAIVSAVICIALLAIDLKPIMVTSIISVLGLILFITIYRSILDTNGENKDEEGKSKSFLSRYILAFGLIVMIMYLTEGMIYDWSSVYLIEYAAIPIQYASIAYILFEVSIATMRLVGDKLVLKVGPARLLIIGGVIASICLLIIALVQNAVIMLTAFVIAGLALANCVPVIFSYSAKYAPMAPGRAISLVATLGYSGLLLGPGVLGGFATAFSLPAIFILAAVLLLVMVGLIAFSLNQGIRRLHQADKALQN